MVEAYQVEKEPKEVKKSNKGFFSLVVILLLLASSAWGLALNANWRQALYASFKEASLPRPVEIDQEASLPTPVEETKEPFTLYIKSYSPGIGGTPISEIPIGVPLSESGVSKVNINTASQFQLETLLGLDSAIVGKIIDYRPYHKIEDMRKVPGIDRKTFNKIKDRITIKEPFKNENEGE